MHLQITFPNHSVTTTYSFYYYLSVDFYLSWHGIITHTNILHCTQQMPAEEQSVENLGVIESEGRRGGVSGSGGTKSWKNNI